MRRRILSIILYIVLAIFVVAAGGVVFAINRFVASRSGPVYKFQVPADETSLTDERAATIGREVMKRDGFPESSWELMKDDRNKAPDGRSDQFLSRNSYNSNQGYVYFYSANSRANQRFVHIELHDGQITAQGSLGK